MSMETSDRNGTALWYPPDQGLRWVGATLRDHWDNDSAEGATQQAIRLLQEELVCQGEEDALLAGEPPAPAPAETGSPSLTLTIRPDPPELMPVEHWVAFVEIVINWLREMQRERLDAELLPLEPVLKSYDTQADGTIVMVVHVPAEKGE